MDKEYTLQVKQFEAGWVYRILDGRQVVFTSAPAWGTYKNAAIAGCRHLRQMDDKQESKGWINIGDPKSVFWL